MISWKPICDASITKKPILATDGEAVILVRWKLFPKQFIDGCEKPRHGRWVPVGNCFDKIGIWFKPIYWAKCENIPSVVKS